MKKLLWMLIVAALALAAVPAVAAKAKTDLHDRAALVELSALQARRSMLTLCGVTGDDLEKTLAKDKERETRLVASLSEEGKKALPEALTKIDNGVKASWDTTSESVRAKSCEALKEKMAAGK